MSNDDGRMGDHLHQQHHPRVSLVVAGSVEVAPVLPIHEARAREERTQHELAQRLDLESGGHELQEIHSSTSKGKQKVSHQARDSGEIPSIHYDDLSSSSSSSSETDPQMPHKKSKSRSPNPRGSGRGSLRGNGSLSTKSSISSLANGHTGDSDVMNGSFLEQRRKHHASLDIHDEDSLDARERLMGRSDFSLDDVPPAAPNKEEDTKQKGFFDLPVQDRRNFLLLVLLYFLQGIPMGLAGGSVPFLLKSHLSYSQIGVYSLASYPYSLKLLWSPIVDAVWSGKVGRRKSWILPIQTISGFGMIWLGTRAEQMMVKAGEDNGAGIWGFTGWWFALVFMCATQDIAVDGKMGASVSLEVFILT